MAPREARGGMLPLRAFSAPWGSSLRGGASFSCAHGPRLRAFLCSGRALPKAHAYPSDLYRLFGHAC